MIFNNEFLFLHFPKTGGMMLTGQLLTKLKGPVHYTIPKGHLSPKERMLKFLGRIKVFQGLRHENLIEAEELLTTQTDGLSISKFKLIVVIVRNPYDYMMSRYHYLKYVQKHNKEGVSMKLAKEGDFTNFVLSHPPEYNPVHFIKDENDNLLSNMAIVKYENMYTELNALLNPYLKEPIEFKKRINESRSFRTDYRFENEVEKIIYYRNRSLFELGLYKRREV